MRALRRFPKTLIFAVNDLPHTSHADTSSILLATFSARAIRFVQKITGRVDRPLQESRVSIGPEPHVVLSVDMLKPASTFLILNTSSFLRPVKSRILFEQMLGRALVKAKSFRTSRTYRL